MGWTNAKIQVFFKALKLLSRIFRSRLNFQGVFKKVLNIQVLLKSEYDQEIPQSHIAEHSENV